MDRTYSVELLARTKHCSGSGPRTPAYAANVLRLHRGQAFPSVSGGFPRRCLRAARRRIPMQMQVQIHISNESPAHASREAVIQDCSWKVVDDASDDANGTWRPCKSISDVRVCAPRGGRSSGSGDGDGASSDANSVDGSGCGPTAIGSTDISLKRAFTTPSPWVYEKKLRNAACMRERISSSGVSPASLSSHGISPEAPCCVAHARLPPNKTSRDQSRDAWNGKFSMIAACSAALSRESQMRKPRLSRAKI